MTRKPKCSLNTEIIAEALRRDHPKKYKREKLRQAMAGSLIEARQTEKCGKGLFAKADFSVGEVIGPIDGERIRTADVTPDLQDYALSDGDGYSIVPNLDRVGWHLANNSCAPNANLGTFERPGEMYAVRPIKRGDEITVHYGWQASEKSVECVCSSPHCFGNLYILPKQKVKLVAGMLQTSLNAANRQRIVEYLESMIQNRNLQGMSVAYCFARNTNTPMPYRPEILTALEALARPRKYFEY